MKHIVIADMIENQGSLSLKEICLLFKELISRQDIASLSWIEVFESFEQITWAEYTISNLRSELETKVYSGEGLPESVVELITKDEKIKAIIKIRELTGFGLRKAKQMFDLYYVEHKLLREA